ncbi:MAG: glucose-6-phosphate isomerase, partial [Tepidanaerobacteraceae bacterium]|nr:glucose-6-phosphate isomerase [Tepidanaerobacteraceae bacterium]
ISINVKSKSGTTTEPAIVFRVLKEYMEDKYGSSEASKRIYVTRDKSKGALKALADQEGYETFVIPDNIGGRYSVLAPVGLLPMAVAGIDIDEVMKGGQAAAKDLTTDDLEYNFAYQYAAIRNVLYSKGKTTEIMVSYEPNLLYFGEWYKQLFGESEGKDGKGIFPTALNFTTDLHSMGQYIQDGRKDIFETVLDVAKSRDEIIIKENEDDMDGLNYISGRTLDFVNKKAMEGSISAHVDGGVPNLVVNIPEVSPYYFGYLVYFFEKACGMSGYLLGVNPFDQPGVEAYKTNMFRLLGKPGY